jgi:hypothetical protein
VSGKVDPYVVCPYYKKNEKQKIHCEGVENDTALHIAFSTPQKLQDYRKQYCRRCWKECLIAEMLNRRWEYDA